MKIRTEKGKYLNVFFSFFFFSFAIVFPFCFFPIHKNILPSHTIIFHHKIISKKIERKGRELWRRNTFFFCFWLLNETMSVFFAIRRGWSCHFQKCWTEKNGDCTLRVNMTRMCSETIRKTSIASGERETHFSLKIIGSHHSLSLSLVKTTLHNAIKRTRIHRFYFEFLFFKENIGIYPLRETTFCFSLSLHTFRVLLFPCFVWRKNRGRDIMKSFRFKRKAFFVFVFFSTCVCVYVCFY